MSDDDAWFYKSLGPEAEVIEAEFGKIAELVAQAETQRGPDRYAAAIGRVRELQARLAAAHPEVASHCPDPYRSAAPEGASATLTEDSPVRSVLSRLHDAAHRLHWADRRARMRELTEAEFRDALALVCSRHQQGPLAELVAKAALRIDAAKRKLGVRDYEPLIPREA